MYVVLTKIRNMEQSGKPERRVPKSIHAGQGRQFAPLLYYRSVDKHTANY